MENNQKISDITIIGGGPVGLFTAFYAGMREASVKIIESLPELGGQLAALYPEKYIYDVAGFPKIKGKDLVENLKDQMEQFDNEIVLNQSVQHVTKENDIFKIVTNSQVHFSRTIIITAGNGAFKPKTMKLDNEEYFAEKNLHYKINELEEFRNKEVVVFGGGDSAVDWALMLEDVASKVSIIHRRTKFRAHDYSVSLMRDSSIDIFTPYVPVELSGNRFIEAVKLKKEKDEESFLLEADDYIVNYGFVSNLGPINEWGLEINKNQIVVNHMNETNIPGIYAVGDVATYEGKIRLIASGFGEAPTAVSCAKMFIDPESSFRTAHSTHLMEKKIKENKVAIN